MALLREQMKQELARKKQVQQQPPGYRQIEAGQPPQSGAAGEPVNATPEEQAIYEKVVLSGMKVIYADETHGEVMNMLRTGEPAQALGVTAAKIIEGIDEKNEGRIPETVILPAGMELMDALAELAETAKLFPVDDANLAENAVHIFVTTLANTYGYDQAELQQLLQQHVPPKALMPAGREAAQNPMKWTPVNEQNAQAAPTEARDGNP